MSVVYGYHVFPLAGAALARTETFYDDNPTRAATRAKELAKKYLCEYAVCKMVVTHIIKAPQVAEPEVKEYPDADAVKSG